MGKGACQAIEDALILQDEIKNNSDIRQAFKAFEGGRMKRTHEIINMSWRIGKIAQLENSILARLRNFFFRRIPSSFNENS